MNICRSPTQSSTQRKEQKRDKVRGKAELDIKDNRVRLGERENYRDNRMKISHEVNGF